MPTSATSHITHTRSPVPASTPRAAQWRSARGGVRFATWSTTTRLGAGSNKRLRRSGSTVGGGRAVLIDCLDHNAAGSALEQPARPCDPGKRASISSTARRHRPRLLLDGSADPPKVPSEGVGRIGRTLREVVVEGRPLPQRVTLDRGRRHSTSTDPTTVPAGTAWFE